MKQKVRITFTEGVLGTCATNKEIYTEFIASKAPDAKTTEEEVEALGVDEVAEKGMTIFPKTEDGIPYLYDYQVKGFFKGACSFLRMVTGSESAKVKAYKKKIDGTIFVSPRRIEFNNYGEIKKCERPLRAQTMQGERVSLACSEEIPAGSYIDFEVELLNESDFGLLLEWLDYGEKSGIGQWRNSGKGRFTYELLD